MFNKSNTVTEFYLYVICCVCGKDLGTKPCEEAQHLETSHTYCPECQKRALEEIDEG